MGSPWLKPAEIMLRMSGGDVTKLTVRSLWNVYLIASYMYYVRDVSLMDDSKFDQICVLLKEYSLFKVNAHGAWHLQLWDDDALRAGTGFHITRDNVPHSIECIGDTIINIINGEAV